MGTTVVSMKLTATELLALDQVARIANMESRSAALRAGMALLFEKHKLKARAEQQIEQERRAHQPRRSANFSWRDAIHGTEFGDEAPATSATSASRPKRRKKGGAK